MSIGSDKPAILRITVRHSPTIKSDQRIEGGEIRDWWRLSWGNHHIVDAIIQHIACLHRSCSFDSQLRKPLIALYYRYNTSPLARTGRRAGVSAWELRSPRDDYALTNRLGLAFNLATSRAGGAPNRRLYSRVNCEALS